MPQLPQTMRAAVLHSYDGPGALSIEDRPLPRPAVGEVLIRMHAAPINPSDQLFLLGRYGVRKPLPVIPGFEGSGTVVAAGGGIERALVGRRVACAAQHGDGTWAEYLAVPATTVIPLLPHVSLDAGATLLVNPMTAYALVELARRGGHRAMVQTAAASALGRMIVRLAAREGITLINIVRRAEQAQLLRRMGAAHVLDSGDVTFDTQLAQLCERHGATLAIDAVAGELSGRVLRALPHSGRLTIYGALSGEPAQIDPSEPLFNAKTIDGFWLSTWFAKRGLLGAARAAVQIQTTLLDVTASPIQASYQLEDIHAALDRYQHHMSDGKVLLRMPLTR